MKSLTVHEKLEHLPPYLLREVNDYLDFLLHKYYLPIMPKKSESAGLFGICRGEIETLGDIISPLDEEWDVLK